VYWEQTVQCEAATDIGLRRKNNEDSHCVHVCQEENEWRRTGHLLMVADGMGGHAVGELASRLAIETVPHVFLKSSPGDPRRQMHDAVVAANQAIYERGTQNVDFLHMGTTCSALALTSRGAVIGHVGDSRVYRVRRDRIDQLTFDHSLQWELERQHGDLQGIVDLSQHKNIITRSLGPEESVEVDVEGPILTLPGDSFLLCSDGLSNQLTDSEMGAIVRELPPTQAARLLINLANIRGGPDNITAIVARVGELPANVTPRIADETFGESSGLSGFWLAGIWSGAGCLAIGIGLLLFHHRGPGGFFVALGCLILAVLIGLAIRFRPASPKTQDSDEFQTQHSRPYRTAVGLSSSELADLLLRTDFELQRSAREDGWNVNWEEHDRAIASSQALVREKRHSRAVRDVARAIQIVMSELPRRTL